MTLVHIDLRYPDGSPVRGFLDWTPTRRREVDDHFVLPAQVRVELVDGEASIEVASTEDGAWAWRVEEHARYGVVRYVLVPDDASVEYTDLVDVDPESLEPVPDPGPIWQEELEEIREELEEIQEDLEALGLESATHVVEDVTYTQTPDDPVIRRQFSYPIATADPDLWLNVNESGQRISSLNEWGALRGFAMALPWYDSLVRAIRQDTETAVPGGPLWSELEDRRSDREADRLYGSRWADGLPVQRDQVVGHVFVIHPWESLADVPGTLAPNTVVVQRDGEAV